jgi:hypothetical protein
MRGLYAQVSTHGRRKREKRRGRVSKRIMNPIMKWLTAGKSKRRGGEGGGSEEHTFLTPAEDLGDK